MNATKNKSSAVLYRHRFSLFVFLYLVLYHVTVVNRFNPWKLTDFTYSIYCVDFSFGFASKLLPGAIYNLIFGTHTTQTAANVYAVVIILLLFVGIALMLEKFLLQIPQAHRHTAAFLLLFILSGPYTFSIFTNYLGIADTYWLLLVLLFLLFSEHKTLRFFIPVVFMLALMIHFSAFVFYIPTFSIILLYQMAIAKGKYERRVYGVVFAVSLMLTTVLFFFLLLNETKMICPIDEFHRKLQEHGTNFFTYYDYSFFRIWEGQTFIPDSVREMAPSLAKFFHLFYYQIKLSWNLLAEAPVSGLVSTIGGTIILTPCVYCIFTFLWRRLQKDENLLLRLCSFLMLAQFPFVYFLGLLFAIGIDMTRYLTHAFLGLITCLLTVLYHEENARTLFFENMAEAEKSISFKIYFLAYATMTLMPV